MSTPGIDPHFRNLDLRQAIARHERTAETLRKAMEEHLAEAAAIRVQLNARLEGKT